jgi:broad specificity phosphatase PhoE
MGRHGNGWHNAAQDYYGTPAWNCYWSELDGNGTVTWMDAHLTDLGVTQAETANIFWASQIADQKQLSPRSYYTSPMFRCLQTANITFGNLSLPSDYPFVPTVKELLRETIDIHTCDERSNLTVIENAFPTYKIEDGFTEEDELWNALLSEPEAAQVQRSEILLDDVFSNDDNTWLSFTTHSGEATAMLTALGHISFSLATGAVIPVFVKAVINHKVAFVPESIAYTASATCNAVPVTSLATGGCVCSSGSAVLSATASPTVSTSAATITAAPRLKM